MTVKMTRTEPMHEGGPIEADVHQSEVGNWLACGWVEAVEANPLSVVEEPKPEPMPMKGKPGRKPKSA